MTEYNADIKNRLKEALQHIRNKDYAQARSLLEQCNDHPLGHKLLLHFDTVAEGSVRISSVLHE